MTRVFTILLLLALAFALDRAVGHQFGEAQAGAGGLTTYNGGSDGTADDRASEASHRSSTTGDLGNSPLSDRSVVSVSARRSALADSRKIQGRNILWWHRRAVQARKDANKRQQTIYRLKRERRRGFIPWYWVAIASCESGVNWTYNGSSGFDGAVQFHPGTWSANRLSGYPRFAYLASPFQQLVVAEIVLARSGWGQWPACSRKVGLR